MKAKVMTLETKENLWRQSLAVVNVAILGRRRHIPISRVPNLVRRTERASWPHTCFSFISRICPTIGHIIFVRCNLYRFIYPRTKVFCL